MSADDLDALRQHQEHQDLMFRDLELFQQQQDEAKAEEAAQAIAPVL